MRPTITAVIITKNEEKMIANCLEALRWCDQVIVMDNGSDDKTLSIAKQLHAHVFEKTISSFADLRNAALNHVTTDWVMYIDADERVTPPLSKEILVQIETTQSNALAFNRLYMAYGRIFEYGGWREEINRVFRVSAFKGWTGDIHESPNFEGEVTLLHTPLLHLTHRNTVDGLQKTISWTPIEAKLLAESNIPPVTVFTIFRKGMMEFIRRAILKKGHKDGMEGWVEAIVQGINRMLVYIQVWEMQQKPPIAEKYEKKELEISNWWKEEK